MKLKYLLLNVFCILVVLAAPVGAASLADWLDSAKALALASGPLTELQFSDPRPRLLPGHENLKVLIQGLLSDLSPNIMVENLSLYTKPAGAAPLWTPAERAFLYNQALSISTLAGIQYFSTSRNTMRTFYETSRVIDGPLSKKPLPDPVFHNPPDSFSLYARQKDLTFGDNIYRYDYYSWEEAFSFVQQNLTSMNAGIIPGVSKNNLRSVMAVIDAGEYLLIYAISMAKAPALPGLKERIGNSFSTRIEAVLGWFSSRAEWAFQ